MKKADAMNKMFLLLAAGVGAAILTGCSDPVMDNRYYKDNGSVDTAAPPPADDAVVAKPAEVPAAQQEVKELPEAKASAKAEKSVRTYEPMQQLESDKITGIDENYVQKRGKADTGKSRVYTVKKGDTLGGIAYRNRVTLSSLLAANNMEMKDAKRLRIGQKLTIPAPGSKVAVKKSAKAAKKTAAKKSAVKSADKAAAKVALNADGTYSVKRGDSPERIARKLKVKLDDLLKANNLDEAASRRLQIGQKLIVPGAQVVESAPGAAVADKPVEAAETAATAPAEESKTAAATNAADDLAAQLEKTLQTPAAPGASAEAAGSASATAASGTEELYVVREAEISLVEFAKQHNTTVEELKKLNPEIADMLTRNDVVNLPAKK